MHAKTISTITFLSSLALMSGAAFAEETQSQTANDLSLEDILNLKVTVASKTKESLLATPGTVYVVTEDDIRKNGWMSLREVLASIPNMELMWQWDWLAGGQRGFADPGNFSNTLLLIDGREVQNIMTNEAFITSVFNTHKVARIEILQGPNSTLYGAAAMQGVINIITKYGEDGQDVASVQAIRGEVGTQQFSGVFRKSGQDYTLGMSASFYHSDQNYKQLADFAANTDLYSRHAKAGDVNGNPVDMEPFRYKGFESFHIPEDSYTLDLYSRYKDFYAGIDFYKTINKQGIEVVQLDYTANEARRGAELYYAGIKHKFSDNTWAQLELQYLHETDDWLGLGYDAPIPQPTQWSDQGGTTKDHYYVANYRVGDPNYAARIRSLVNHESDVFGHWVAGYDYTMQNFKDAWAASAVWAGNQYVTPNDYFVRRDQSFFAEDTLPLVSGLSITAGARYALSNYVNHQILPRVSLVYQPTSSSALKATYGEGYRGPDFWEQPSWNVDKSAAVKMRMAELNYTQQARMGSSTLMNTAAAYWMQMPYHFTVTQNSSGYPYIDVSSDPFNVRGFEDQVKLNFGDFTGFAGFRYALPDKRGLSGHPELSYVLNVPLTKFKVGANYRFLAHYDANVFVDHWASVQTDGPSADGTTDEMYVVPAWTTLNAKLGVSDIKLDTMKARLDLYVENLFDTAYYHANIRGLGASPLQFLQAPRNFRLQLTLDL